jgi:2-polyprenyl-3-methyl-5-hydroxy-6-metoxy-1,4-benzoquinol methylase
MLELLILKGLDPASAAAPEFQYLLSWCRLQASEVFGSVELLVDPEPPVAVSAAGAVLVLGPQNALVTAHSLRVMRERLAAGAGEVRPVRLQDVPLPARGEVYSLRGYEAIERRALAAAEGLPVPPSHLPVALFSGSTFRRVAERVPLRDLLHDDSSLRRRPPGDDERPVRAGLCHEFIDYYGEERRDILPYVPPGSRVLEIGCGRGRTGELLASALGCEVTGVELNPVVASEAQARLRRVWTGDFQSLEIDDRFDVVLALELCEHLPEAEAGLAKMKSLLRPGGRLVLSVPNVGHHSVVGDLLAGRWDYLPIGLLCYTHFRFFTRRTLADWLRRSGFERFTIEPQRTPLPAEFQGLAGAVEIDADSLATKGFYVVAYR